MNAHLSTEHWTPPPRDEWNRYASAYQREKQAQDSLDRNDVLVATRDALLENTKLRDICTQRLTRHLIVDNFEDVNALQYQLIRLMTGPEKSVCVAMDPNQSFRRWGSVLPDLNKQLEQFTDDYDGAQEYLLAVNHRTSSSIMQSWHKLAQHGEMIGLENDQQRALRPENKWPETIAVDGTPQDQYRRIAHDIKGLVDAETFGADQIAILARRRSSLLRIGPHLEAVGVPFTTIGNFIGTSDPEVLPVLAMLTLAANPKNAQAFRNAGGLTANGFHHNLNPRIVGEVRSAANRWETDLIEAAIRVRTDLPPNSTAHEELSHIIELHHELQRMIATPGVRVAAMLELVRRQLHRAPADRTLPPPSDDMTRLTAWAKYLDETASNMSMTRLAFRDDAPPIDVRSTLLEFLDKIANGTDLERLSSEGGGLHGNGEFRWPPWIWQKAWNGER